MALQKGDKAPDVTLPSHSNEQTSLASLYGKQRTVLVFFPLAFTSTCTEELCTFRDDLSGYNGVNARVVAISVDSPFVLDRFRKEIGADYLFLSDFNREASRAFGVLREAPVGPGLLNVSDRSVFVVDTDGTVIYAWHSTNPGLLPPFDEVKAALQA
ncbi:MAG TPA: peroxiredoxin [Longimicrobium sp.]|nr:peroxiredoxin [Longimicrobium sp.]